MEKRESMFSEASFRNSLKNETEKEKSKSKKSDKDEEDDDKDLTDAEKDARDYQLQRGMEMVIAMSKLSEKPKIDSDETKKDSDKKSEKPNKSDKKK